MVWKKKGNLNVQTEENLIRCKIGSILEKPLEISTTLCNRDICWS